MPGNTFGTIFRLTSFGESHGEAIGGIIDGCPSKLPIDIDFIQRELNRRKPGQSGITTSREEDDKVQFLSGIFNGKTTAAPIAFLILNKNQKSEDYEFIKEAYRPSHADYTYEKKFGNRDYRGGGRASARETVSRVVAGAIGKLFLRQIGISIHAYVSQVGEINLKKSYTELDIYTSEENIVRCPDKEAAQQMIQKIEEVRREGDSLGGIISCVISGAPVGLGEPVFDKLHADLGKAMLSINAVKGFEFGSGFSGAGMRGSEHNDVFYTEGDKIRTKTNLSGGIQGGISNGEDIYFNVAFKPVATISKKQETINTSGEEIEMNGKGRHDPCVLPRAVPIVEAMASMVLMDHYLRYLAYKNFAEKNFEQKL